MTSRPLPVWLAGELLRRLDPEDTGMAQRRLAKIDAAELIESAAAACSRGFVHELLPESYVHANGFYKISFPGVNGSPARARLHVWPGSQESGRKAESDVHNHKWPFASRVLAGGLAHSILARRPGHGDYTHFRQVSETGRGYTFMRIGDASLEEKPAAAIHRGVVYEMEPATIHKVSAAGDGYAATLVIELAPVSKATDVFVAHGGKPENVIVQPQRLGAAEITLIIARLAAEMRHAGTAADLARTA
jgi:hypothetical protein